MSGVILYTTDDGKSRIRLHAQGDTVWLSKTATTEEFSVVQIERVVRR